MTGKNKSSYEYAVFMYKLMRGKRLEMNESLCRRMQGHNPNVFEELCDLIHCNYDFHTCAKELTDLEKQPLVEFNYD